MSEEKPHTRLDAVIDQALRECWGREAPPDLRRRVLSGLAGPRERPAPPRLVPLLACATLLLAWAAALLLRTAAPPASVPVASLAPPTTAASSVIAPAVPKPTPRPQRKVQARPALAGALAEPSLAIDPLPAPEPIGAPALEPGPVDVAPIRIAALEIRGLEIEPLSESQP